MPDDEGGELRFKDVLLVGKPGSGIFKALPAQFGWKTSESGKNDSHAITAAEVVSASWRQCLGGGRCMLKVICKSDMGSASRFSGFRPDDMKALKTFFRQHYKVELEEQLAATEGWCWGDVPELPGAGDPDLKIMINDKVCFDVPTGELKQVNALGKTDLQLEFQDPSPGSVLPSEEWLSEIRFMLPGGGPGVVSAEGLKQLLQQRGVSMAGEVLARVREVTIVAPRGKHDFEFFPQSVKIHGKTQTYAAKYDDIRHFFMLDVLPAQLLVVGLNTPLTQGQQSQTHIVLKWHGEEMHAPEELSAERLAAMGLKTSQVCSARELMARLFKEFTKQTVIGPSGKFKELNPTKENSIRCTYKATPGSLFFNVKSLLYVTKPVVFLKHGDIAHVSFNAGKMRGRSFDLDVHMRSGVIHEFTQVENGVKNAVFRFFADETSVQIDNKKEVEATLEGATRRAEGPRARIGAEMGDAGGDDDNEEEDGDFEGCEESDGSDMSSGAGASDDEEPKAKRTRK